jgi:hypothetical protein
MKLPALKGGELNLKETNRPSLIKGKAETACGGFNQSLRRFPPQKSPAIVRFQLGISERVGVLPPSYSLTVLPDTYLRQRPIGGRRGG